MQIMAFAGCGPVITDIKQRPLLTVCCQHCEQSGDTAWILTVQKLTRVAEPEPLIGPGHTFETVTDKISSIVLTRGTTPGWVFGFLIAFSLLMLLNMVVTMLMVKGVGIWGIRIPVAWGFAIVNFVWWIGIGHAGTLISAILLLLHQKWRTSINRFAEAMTIFAVMCAGMFPLLHMGRPWLFYYLMPYPNPMWLWPQFRSPLVWDVFAVSTYFTVSLLFWFVGLIPDFATLRDRAKSKASKIIYGMLSMGWRGSAVHWSRYEIASLLLAGLATPLVVSVHTVVSFDFTIAHRSRLAQHDFPALFRCRRHLFRVRDGADAGDSDSQDLPPGRPDHRAPLDIMAKVMLATGMIVAYGYVMETFMAFYSAQPIRKLHDDEPHDGSLRAALLAVDCLQHRDSAGAVVRKVAPQRGVAVRDFAGGEHWNVAGAVRDRRGQLEPRFHAVSVGHVLSRRGGTGRLIWARSDCSSRCSISSFVSCR